jgi:hypothetical protein
MTRILKRSKLGMLAGVVTVLAAMIAMPRHALSQSAIGGPLTHTEFFMNGTNQVMLVQINGSSNGNFFAQVTSPGCSLPNNPIDTLKVWVSLAEFAQASGKTTTLYYQTCNGQNYFTDMVIDN